MFKEYKGHRQVLFIFAIFIFISLPAFAQDTVFSKRCDGTYFAIYYQAGLAPLEIASKIDIYSSQTLSGNSYIGSPDAVLAKTVDVLFLEASDILDIHLYSFKGNIKICRDSEALKSVFYGLYHKNLGANSFYVYETNTIYLDASNLRVGILGHEMAHAIISHYFVVLPPVKIQEVLAGYVEYQLKKKSK